MGKFYGTILVLVAFLTVLSTACGAGGKSFSAKLDGVQEVPPVVTEAKGEATVKFNSAMTQAEFEVKVSNIMDVTMAHIHLAAAGKNGTPVVWLYPSASPAKLILGKSDGKLATGTFTAANLVGPLAGKSLNDLFSEITAGNAYVNVHTSKNPSGEIRGQLSKG
ncbi:MAG: hypothetical protein HW414_246 [Dehalococcoidia bacterium]|nr:hypothetical protein [Dehalococcoidia bacterium]